jgi:hypothetical protein
VATRLLAELLIVSCALALGACRPPAETERPSIPADATSELGSSVPTDIAPDSSADATPAGPTAVPAFEGWETINPQALRVSKDGDDLVLELIGPALWLHASRGVMFHTDVTGDFRVTATVRTSKASDPDSPPGTDGTIQLAGLMARAEVPAENYVFVVTGSIGLSTGVETETTTSSNSIYVQRGVGDGETDLRLCRAGPTFRLAFRPAGTSEAWQPLSTFERPDLPATLQVGANIHTDAVPDLVARFEGLTIEPLEPGDPC